jgi:N utilization substance protein B
MSEPAAGAGSPRPAPRPRDVRRNALQALYQFDAGNTERLDLVRESLDDSSGGHEAHERGMALALLAWEFHDEADRELNQFSPDWPTHRQPVVDRSILRLAWYEMRHGGAPPKVVINEAVELAKEFSTEKSPMFINGVLDRLFRSMRSAVGADAAPPDPAPSTATPGGAPS